LKYNSDNYGGVALGVIFFTAGATILINLLYRVISRKGFRGEGRFVRMVPLRKTFPPFAYFWNFLFGISVMGLGAATCIDNLVYADTHRHQSGAFLVFWIPFAFCIGTAGVLGSRENFRSKNPVLILFSRAIASIFVIVSLWLCWQFASHFDSIRLADFARGYFADIGHLIHTGTPLA
jgi:hypothetical protein